MVELGDFKHDQAGGFMACCERSEPLRGNDKGLEFFSWEMVSSNPENHPFIVDFPIQTASETVDFPACQNRRAKSAKIRPLMDGCVP